MDKSLVKNTAFNVFYKFLSVVFPLISIAYVSHVIMANGIGKVTYAQNIAQYFVLLSPLGIPSYGIKTIAKNKNTKFFNDKFSELFTINFLSTTLFLIIYYSMILSVGRFQSDLELYLIAGLAIAFNYINVDWFFQGIEEFLYIALRSFAVKILSLVSLLLFVRKPEDFNIYALIYVLAIGGNNVFNILRIRKEGIHHFFKFSGNSVHLKPILLLTLNSLAIELYTLFDTTMLGFCCNESTIGYYTSAIKIVRVWVSVITAISGVLLPRLSFEIVNGKEEHIDKLISQVLSVMLYISIPSMIGMFALADYIIPFVYGDSFLPSIITMQMATPLIIILGLSYLFGTQVLIPYNAEHKLLISSLFGTVSNVVLNSLLIPIFYQNGAVVASVISETLVVLLTFLYSLKYIRIHLKAENILTPIIGSIVMLFVLVILRRMPMGDTTKLFVCIFTGVMIYGVIISVFNEKIRNYIKKYANKLTNRIK